MIPPLLMQARQRHHPSRLAKQCVIDKQLTAALNLLTNLRVVGSKGPP